MAQETLNIVITADNKDAINNINQTVQATNSLGTAMGKVPQAAGQANQALINSGRVLQDLNYGFVGIANNLNPLLESFQRLGARAEETGSSVKKELISALTGPAGIGVALSALTFIFLKFGDDIANMISKVTGGNQTILEFNESLHNSQKSFIEAYTDMYKLGKAFEDFHEGLISKKDVLAEYNRTLGDTYGKTNNVAEAEKIWAANSENFIKSSVLRAAALLQIQKAAKLAADAFEVSQQPAAKSTSYSTSVLSGFASEYSTQGVAKLQSDVAELQKKDQNEKIAGIKKEEQFHLDVVKAINKEINALKESATYTKFIGQELPKGFKIDDSAMKQYQKDLESYIRAEKDVIKPKKGMNTLDYKLPEDVDLEKVNITKMSSLYKEIEKKRADDAKSIKDQEQSYKNFAKTLSGDVTNGLMGLFEALEQGKNPLQSIGDMFANIAKQIAAMVIEATIFEAIMTAFPELKAVFETIGVVSKVVPHAEGGITTGPHIGLVGEAGPEAIMPLSKLGSMIKTTFNAGAMSGTNNGGGGQFVLRGQDLLVAINRTQKASSLKGQNISLA